MVGLYLLHSVGGQIVKHHTIVALEEILSIEHQLIHLLTLHEYAPVVFQLHTVHLTDKCVEHRPFGQVECIGIEGNRVTTVGHLNLGSPHHDLAQLVNILSHAATLFHIVPRRIEIGVAGDVTHVVVNVGCLIVGVLGADDVLLFAGWDVETVGEIVLSPARPLLKHVHRIDYSGVLAHQGNEHVLDANASEGVLDMSPEGNGALFLLSFLIGFLCPCRHGDEGEDEGDDLSFLHTFCILS